MSAAVPVLVVAALRAEVAAVLRRLEAPAHGTAGCAGFVRGRLKGAPVVVAWTGDGQACAREGLTALLDATSAERLLVIGVAGGLSPGLETLEVIAAQRVVDGEAEAPAPHAAWVGDLGARVGTMLSVPRIAVSRQDKAMLWERLGRPAVATVDLETSVYARVASARGLPYAALRAVSDPAAETLPVDFNALRDDRGRVGQARVARWAIGHPTAVPRLMTLGRRVRACATRLADLAESFCARRAAPLLLALLVSFGCAGRRQPVLPPPPEPSAPPRLLVFALDAVPFETVVQVVEQGGFDSFGPPAALVSTFPSATSLAMSGILEPFGLAPSNGYEARFFDRQRNRVRGGGLFSYNKLKAPWRSAWDWKAGNVRKLTSGIAPIRASRAAIDEALAAFVASDDPVFLAYTDATDLVGHLKSPSALGDLLDLLDRRIEALHEAHPDRPFHTVLFSDHGQAGGQPLRNVRRDVRRALQHAGLRLRDRIRGPRDVVLVSFGLLSSIIGYAEEATAVEASSTLSAVEGVDLCVTANGADGWLVQRGDARARIERSSAGGSARWRYVDEKNDPLRLGALLGAEAAAWQDDAWWRHRTVDHAYPDPFHRISRGFDLVENPASLICSLEVDAMFGALLTSVSSLLSVGHLEWTHGALHIAPSLGFVASDLPGWNPSAPLRFDEALLPFAAYARDVLGVDPVIEAKDEP